MGGPLPSRRVWLVAVALLHLAQRVELRAQEIKWENVAKPKPFKQDYSGPGPLTTEWIKTKLDLPATLLSRKLGDKLVQLFITITAPRCSAVSPIPGLYPVVLLLNGFQTLAESYKPYAERVASYGYVVVQYDIAGALPVPGLLPEIDIRVEVEFLPHILEFLAIKSSTPGDVLCGIVDTTRVATMGHSRGGKLAALHLAEYPYVHAACLLDPVDGDDSMPETVDNPSALKALAGSGKIAAVVGAGIPGECAPPDYNYARFKEVLGGGSWVQVIKEAGHTQVVDLTGPAAWIADWLCGAGNITRVHAIAIALPSFIAWLEKSFRPQEDVDEQLHGFFKWVQHTVASGDISFEITGKSPAVHAVPDAATVAAASQRRLAGLVSRRAGGAFHTR